MARERPPGLADAAQGRSRETVGVQASTVGKNVVWMAGGGHCDKSRAKM